MSRLVRNIDCLTEHASPQTIGAVESLLCAAIESLSFGDTPAELVTGKTARTVTIDGQRQGQGLAYKVDTLQTFNNRGCVLTASVQVTPGGHDGRYFALSVVVTRTYQDGTVWHVTQRGTLTERTCGCPVRILGLVGRIDPNVTTPSQIAAKITEAINQCRTLPDAKTPVRDGLGHRSDVTQWVHRDSVPDWQDRPNGGRIIKRKVGR